VTSKVAYAVAGLRSAVLLAIVLVIGWFGWRPLFRVTERSFWSLNALIVQPIYAIFQEALHHLAERWLPSEATPAHLAGLRAAAAGAAGIIVSGLALLIIIGVWSNTYLFRGIPDVGSVQQLTIVAAIPRSQPRVSNATGRPAAS